MTPSPTTFDRENGRHLWRLAGYSATAIPLAVMLVPATALVPIYYSDVHGLALATIGTILLLSRIFDVATDPAVGLMSDRTTSKFGRRRIWMAAGVPVLLIGVWLLFVPPVEVTGAYLLVASLITYLGWTLIQIPYWSWGAEIAPQYHDRSTLSGFRETAMIAGIAVASLAPLVASSFGHGIDRTTMMAMAIIITVLLPVTVLISAKSFREIPVSNDMKSGWSDLIFVLTRNPHFARLVVAFCAIELGKGAGLAVTAYLVTYYFGQPELIGLVLLLPYILIIVSVPFWLAISRRCGKARTIALSLGCAAAILAIGVPLLSREDGYVFLALECLVGLAAGGFAILPTALVADTADYFADAEGREPLVATHFSAWSLSRKFMQAIAIGIALPLLAFAGFDPSIDPNANVAATKWMFILLSVPFYVAGIWLMWGYKFSAADHRDVRARLQVRDAENQSSNGIVS
ncbi:MFS transporter [Pacificimonas sp. WHA3]|uniref:MFS transporter n=1 Tax=Pacificimonas pallii TaxID=2827236 RepID=A0ABS6SAC7_9SPHN|nr:MFS transporter [Pacificimonas pallii]MBV7255324.1 MFS transporter [Pacificimonas pallii]